jgi:hypothetical protein
VIPGIYFLSATARPWYAVHPTSLRSEGAGNSTPVVDASLDVSYPTTFYPGTTEADAATPVPIKGEHVQIDIRLEPVPSLHLLFHVAENGQSGLIPPRLEKRVFDYVEETGNEGMEQVSPDTYELVGVPAGRYTVRLHSNTPGEADLSTEMDITKNGQELDSTPGEPLGSLKLSVKIIGEEKLPQQLSIFLRDSHLQTAGFQQVDQNGETQFRDLPAGKYFIGAVSAAGKRYSVSRTSSLGTETSGNSVNLTPGASLSVSVLLLAGTTKVEGFAKRSGKAAAGVMVVLVPKDPESNTDLFRRDQSDSDGSFVLPGIVPGSYTVIAIEDGWSVDWSRPMVLARYTPRGQKLTIGPPIQSSVNLSKPIEVQPR